MTDPEILFGVRAAAAGWLWLNRLLDRIAQRPSFSVRLLKPLDRGPLNAVEFRFEVRNRSSGPLKLHTWWPVDPMPPEEDGWEIVPAPQELAPDDCVEVVVRLQSAFTKTSLPQSNFVVRFALTGMWKPLSKWAIIGDVLVGQDNVDTSNRTADWWAKRVGQRLIRATELPAAVLGAGPVP
jgi:hypothetical protein